MLRPLPLPLLQRLSESNFWVQVKRRVALPGIWPRNRKKALVENEMSVRVKTAGTAESGPEVGPEAVDLVVAVRRDADGAKDEAVHLLR
jgi:hypothetical protein